MSQANFLAGRYEAHHLLGEGGMSSVYAGLDTVTEQRVAIKLLKQETTSSKVLVERFIREGEALRRLNHPNIVKMLDAFVEDGKHYVIMELVTGGDLHELIKRQGRMPLQRVLEIGLDLADALTRAHRLNIIHRDIKPANILIAEDGTPRLTDFGVARLSDSTDLTKTGTVVGTISYLSPEGCMGEVLDARGDIWSFGVVLYEMLTGRQPFSVEEANTVGLITAILTLNPPPIENFRSDVPPALKTLIWRMLEKDKNKRISSARMVGSVLEALLKGGDADAILAGNVRDTTPLTPVDPVAASSLNAFQQVVSEFNASRATPTPPAPQTVAHEFPKTTSRRRVLVAGLAAVLGIIVLALLTLPNLLTNSIPLVEPVKPDEYMVLVAQLELLNGATTDVSRFIVDDLKRKFEVESPFSSFRIRAYPGVIESSEQALEVAEANKAPLIFWGTYDGEAAIVNVQVGSLAPLGKIPFSREHLEKTINVQYRLTDPREQSLASAIAVGYGMLTLANSDIYNGMAVGVSRGLMNFTPAEVIGSSAAAHLHRANTLYGDDAAMLEQHDEAIRLDSANPMIYALRAVTRARSGQIIGAGLDMGTMRQLAPADWPSMDNFMGFSALFVSNNPPAALPFFDAMVEAQPDDWYGYNIRAIAYFVQQDYDNAEADAKRAIELGAKTNWPYTIVAPMAMRGGRLQEAQDFIRTVRSAFPNPEQSDMFIQNASGLTREQSPQVAANAAFGQLTLFQWDSVLENVALAGNKMDQVPILYLFKGIAECNLSRYADAEASYSALLKIDPDFIVVHLLRAEVRREQRNPDGMQADFDAVRASTQADVLEPFIAPTEAGEITCQNIFTVDLSAYEGKQK